MITAIRGAVLTSHMQLQAVRQVLASTCYGIRILRYDWFIFSLTGHPTSCNRWNLIQNLDARSGGETQVQGHYNHFNVELNFV